MSKPTRLSSERNATGNDADGESSAANAKKKKKKAGDKKDEKPAAKSKGPNKKVLVAMQQALAKRKEGKPEYLSSGKSQTTLNP